MKKEDHRLYQRLSDIRRGVICIALSVCGFLYLLRVGIPEQDGLRIRYAETLTPGNKAAETESIETGVRAPDTLLKDNPGQAPAEETVPESPGSLPENPAEDRTPGAEAREAPREDGLVNLNTADAEELATLPGIGPKTAELIIDYRETYGGFAAPEEIMNVKRIGSRTYEKLKDRIKVQAARVLLFTASRRNRS